MEIALVGRGPWFTGLRTALAVELRQLGHFVWEREGMPPVLEHEALLVLGPHDHGEPPRGSALRACIWTEQSVHPVFLDRPTLEREWKAFYDLVFDIHAERARRDGSIFVPAWHEWAGWEGWSGLDAQPRGCAVMFYGTVTPRRAEILTRASRILPIERPLAFLAGEDKRRALLDTKLVVLCHAYDGSAGEPFRHAEAAICGAALVAEAASDTEPWVGGEHFIATDADHLGEAALEALGRFAEMEPMRRRALVLARTRAEPELAAWIVSEALSRATCRAA